MRRLLFSLVLVPLFILYFTPLGAQVVEQVEELLVGTKIVFTANDTTSCDASEYGIYADLSEAVLKKCENGVATDIAGAGGSGYNRIQDEGSNLTQRTTINFTGSGVECVDNASSTRTDCTISGGGGSGGGSTSVNGSSVTDPNFNGSSPAAPANTVNATWQVSGSNVSAYIQAAGAAATGVINTTTQSIAGVKTFLSQIVASSAGVEFTESDSNPTCSAGNYNIFADTSEAKLKKCQNGVTTDLDTTGGNAHDKSYRPTQFYQPSSAYGVFQTRNIRPTLYFDASTDWCVYTDDVVASGWTGSSLVVNIWAAGATATSGNMIFTAALESWASLDLDNDSFASADSVTMAANGTSGVPTKGSITLSGAELDGLTAGNPFRLRICRDADNAGDTMSGNAQLFMVQVVGQ